jgi:hypothetical protein
MFKYDWKTTVMPVEKSSAVAALRDAMVAMFEQIKAIDKSVVIYPWSKANENLPSINTSSEIPEHLSDIKNYFSRVFAKTEGGVCYTSVYIGHNKKFKVIIDDIAHWLKENRFGWFPRELQAENTLKLGWLLFSTRTMDAALLKDAIYKKNGVHVGLRWRMISTGKSGKLPLDQQIRALHLEVDAEDRDGADLIRLMYAHNAHTFPLGIHLRRVPEIDNANVFSMATATQLRARQADFVANIRTATTWEIMALDHPDPNNGERTVRDLIKGIRAKDQTATLFHSIDPHWQNSSYIFTFCPQFEAEAKAMITGLLTYLTHQYPDHKAKIKTAFTRTAQERAATSEWDDDLKCAVSESDVEFAALMTGTYDSAYIFENMAAVVEPTVVEATATGFLRPPCDNSIYTLDSGTGVMSKKVASHPPKKTAEKSKKTQGSVSSASRLSAETTETRLSSLEQTLAGVLEAHKTIQQESKSQLLEIRQESKSQFQMVLDALAVMNAKSTLHPGHPAIAGPLPDNSPRAGGSNAAGQAG